ncbi:Canalicular multispecific organic anion transporter 2, partial [Borealophlyctis nickersoniae]
MHAPPLQARSRVSSRPTLSATFVARFIRIALTFLIIVVFLMGFYSRAPDNDTVTEEVEVRKGKVKAGGPLEKLRQKVVEYSGTPPVGLPPFLGERGSEDVERMEYVKKLRTQAEDERERETGVGEVDVDGGPSGGVVIEDATPKKKQKRLNPHTSIFRTTFHSFGHEFLIAGLFRMTGDTMSVLSPLVLRAIINFLATKNENTRWGFGLVTILFVMQVVQTVFVHKSFEWSMRVGYK